MAWYGTVDDSRKIVQRVRAVKEVMQLSNGRTGSVIGYFQRRNIITSEVWVGIQGTVASAYVQSQAPVGTVEDIVAELASDAGNYTVRQDTITFGTWY